MRDGVKSGNRARSFSMCCFMRIRLKSWLASIRRQVARRFGSGTAAVVVGNPPWGYPKKEDEEGHKALAETVKWCNAKGGTPNRRQRTFAGIHPPDARTFAGWRKSWTADFFRIFFKHHENSRAFRHVWLKSARLEHVVNFAHVRQIFFSGPQREAQGISPFVSVVFEKKFKRTQ